MLFDSSLRKELARSFGATLVVLVTVVMTMMLIRTLGQASKGSVSPSDVMLVMGFTVLGRGLRVRGLPRLRLSVRRVTRLGWAVVRWALLHRPLRCVPGRPERRRTHLRRTVRRMAVCGLMPAGTR